MLIAIVLLVVLLLCIGGGVWAGTHDDVQGDHISSVKLLGVELLLACLIFAALYIVGISTLRLTF